MPQYSQINTLSIAGTPSYFTSAQLTAGATASNTRSLGMQIQITGLNADSLTFTQCMDGLSSSYANATLLRDTGALVPGQSITGSAANGNYSIFGFAGYFQIVRTGNADATLKIGYRSVS